jgi:glucokinase
MSTIPASQQLAIGIDIGGTNSVFGIVNHRGEIQYRGAMSTRGHDNIEDYIDALEKMIQPAIQHSGGIEHIKGIGIGAPNANYYKGTIEHAPNLPWKGIVPFADLITKKFNLPCALTNDAKAAAIGEMMYGATKGMKDFIMITMGTGTGSGIVANGHLIYGHDGFAGELGHTTIIPGGRKHWSTGMLGSLECYCSATGVRLTAIEMIENNDMPSLLRDFNKEDITSKIVYDCAIKGDAIAKEVYRFTGEVLGKALANFVMFSSPEAIVLFGGLCKAGKMLMEPAKEYMEANLLPIFQNKVRLLFSELKEDDSAILGASALVWEIK